MARRTIDNGNDRSAFGTKARRSDAVRSLSSQMPNQLGGFRDSDADPDFATREQARHRNVTSGRRWTDAKPDYTIGLRRDRNGNLITVRTRNEWITPAFPGTDDMPSGGVEQNLQAMGLVE